MSKWDEPYQGVYDEYNVLNRFENLDGVEAKIISRLVFSQTKHAQNIWKLLKYGDINALSQPDLSQEEREALIFCDDGEPTSKRVFVGPWTNNAWTEQSSSLYVYVDRISPQNHMTAVVEVVVETITHTKITYINGDGDKDSSEHPDRVNPNDSTEKGSIVVPFKNRETMLLKSVLAELNGYYIDGIGYLQLNTPQNMGNFGGHSSPAIDNVSARDSFYGHSIHFQVVMAGDSDNSDIGY